MQKKSFRKIEIFQFESLLQNIEVEHFVTGKNNDCREQFSLSLSSVENVAPVITNRKLLADELQIPYDNFVFQQQEHTNNVKVVKNTDRGKGFSRHTDGFADNDAMITDVKDACLMIMGADCVPILFYDPVRKVIGAAHAGWRGTAKGVSIATVKAMNNEYGCAPADILACIGPSIGPENYEVDMPVYNAFSQNFSYANKLFVKSENDGKFMLDLWRANQIQLISAGLSAENIEISGICTYANHDRFFSARKGDEGRFAAGIMLRANQA